MAGTLATWSVRIDRLEILLPVGIHADDLELQPLWVSLLATAHAPARPVGIEQCVDYAPLYHWLTASWPHTPHTPLLETRINELCAFVFGWDRRVHRLAAGIYKQRMSRNAVAVGIERTITRAAFQRQSLATAQPRPTLGEMT